MIETIFAVIFMSTLVGGFMAFMLVNIFYENGNRVIKTVVGIILALLIGCTITGLIKSEQSSDKVNWNNGYCVECGNKWRFANADHTKNAGTVYYWTCDNCGKVIKLHSQFK